MAPAIELFGQVIDGYGIDRFSMERGPKRKLPGPLSSNPGSTYGLHASVT